VGRPDLDRLDDWLFGSQSRRRLLEAMTDTESPGPWSQIELAGVCGVAKKGTIEAPLRRLEELGLARRRKDGRWERGRDQRLASAVRALLDELSRIVGA
jgi:DNA-binding transcriptional ArsR family regulator